MKKVLLAFCLFLGVAGQAADSKYGNVSYGKETKDAIEFYGVVTLKGTTVKGNTEINGRLEASKATLGSLQINGKAALNNCVVNGDAVIHGALTASQTKFQGDITVKSHEIAFSNCTVGSITVKKDKEFQSTQVIEARNGTQIAGPITFESGNGEVWLFKGSAVAGKVKGGKVINK